MYDVKYQKIKQKRGTFHRSQEGERTRNDRQEDEKAKVERLYKEYMSVQAVSLKKVEELQQESRKIVQIYEDITKKEADIENLKKAGRERSRLEKRGEGWVKYLTTGWGRTAADIEGDKVKREQETLQKLASERINIELLEGQKRQLQQTNRNQMERVREFQTQNNLWKEKVTRARNAWEAEIKRSQAELWRAQEDERKRTEKERLAREAKEERERQKEERRRNMPDDLREFVDSRAKASAERIAAARMAKEKQLDEEKLMEQRRARMYPDMKTSSGVRASWTEAGQGTGTQMPENGTSSSTNHRNTRSGSSVHAENWPRVHGSSHCSVCDEHSGLLIFQCPQCGIMACASCKGMVPRRCGREEFSNTWDFDDDD